jgi:putative addiction module killer protein
MGFEVEQLVLANGRCPFEEWLASLADKKTQLVVDARITRLRAGNLGDHKSVGAGVFELRIDHGPGLRVYFGRRGKEIVVLVGGGDKKTQNRDIKKAQELWEQYGNDHR